MFPAFLIQVVIVLVVVGLALLILSQIPMDQTIAKIIRVVILVCVCLWLLDLLIGFMPAVGTYPMRR